MAVYQIGLDAHAYVPGFDGTMFLDPASESGATSGIYVRPGTPDLVHLPAGVQVDYVDCTAEWPTWGQPFTIGLAIYDTAMSVLVDEFRTITDDGIGGAVSILEPIDTPEMPYVMPVEGWLGMRLTNNSAVTFNQYDYTVAPASFRLYLEHSLRRRFTLGKVGFSGTVPALTVLLDESFTGTPIGAGEPATIQTQPIWVWLGGATGAEGGFFDWEVATLSPGTHTVTTALRGYQHSGIDMYLGVPDDLQLLTQTGEPQSFSITVPPGPAQVLGFYGLAATGEAFWRMDAGSVIRVT